MYLMSQNQTICQILYEPESILQYQSDWNRIYESGNFEISLSFFWTYSLIQSDLHKDHQFILIVLEKLGQVTGLIPLIIQTKYLSKIPYRQLSPIADAFAFYTHSDLLIEDITQETISLFIQMLYQIKYPWNILRFNGITCQNSLEEQLFKFLNTQNTYDFLIKSKHPYYQLDLTIPTEKIISKKVKANLRNSQNRLDKLKTPYRYISFQDFESSESILEYLFEIDKNSWKENCETSITSNPEQINFFKKLIPLAYQKNILRCYFLLLNQKPIAYDIGFIHKNTYIDLKTSYHHQYKYLSPSYLLRKYLVQELQNEGIKKIDYCGETITWIQKWANIQTDHFHVVMYKGFLAKLYYNYEALKYRLNTKNIFKKVSSHTPIKKTN